MKTTRTTYVGMDVHMDTIAVSIRLPGKVAPEFFQRTAMPASVKKLVADLKAKYGTDLRACYEAGPTGFGVHRVFENAGVPCDVVAPSLIPRKPGERRKTDRLDAHHLSEMLMQGALTAIHVPTPEDEAARDLVRQASTARSELGDAQRRLRSFLLRHQQRCAETEKWGPKFMTWLRKLKLEQPLLQTTLQMMLRELDMRQEQVDTWNKHLEELARSPAFERKVRMLCCIKGICVFGALVLATELVSPERFRTARQLMSYVGLVVAEDSSGKRQRRLGITKTGNAWVRHILIQAVHAARFPSVNRSKEIKKRRKGQPQEVVDIAMKAERRLHDRHVKLTSTGKHSGKVKAAVARELTGFIWAILQVEAHTRAPLQVDADGVVIH